jgi:hypothetical protein
MSTFTFRPAQRENVSLIIGLIGPSGGGKTFTGMELASGIAGDKPFAVIDTEAGRAKHYADRFKFDHADLRPPFRPGSYADAIKAADDAHYPVILVDSFSHEHAGEGGLLDWHEEEFQRLGGRDTVKMTAWIKPKMAHRKMMGRLLQVRAHLILCFRAEQKIEIRKNSEGKTEIVPKTTLAGFTDWIPIAEKSLPYELTASFMLMPDKPGYPVPIKLQEQHRPLFPLDKPITRDSGAKLAAWAKGGKPVDRVVEDKPKPVAPSTGDLLPTPAPKKKDETPLPGVDSDDEAQAIVKAIDTEKAKLDRQPSPEIWSRLCKEIAGTEELDLADASALTDLLKLVTGLVNKDKAAIARTRGLIKPPAQEGAA